MRRASLAALLLAGATGESALAQNIGGPTVLNPAYNPAINPAINPTVNPAINPAINPTAVRVRPTTGPAAAVQPGQSVTFGQAPQADVLTATISERVTADSNYNLDDPSPGTSYYADTLLGLSYLKQTDTQSLGFTLDTGVRALWEAEQSFDFTVASPTDAGLTYANEWANGLFDAAFDYRQRRTDYVLDIPSSLNQLSGNSYEQSYDANIGVKWGTATQSTYELRFIGNQTGYTVETPDQVARTTLEGQAVWDLQLNPILSSEIALDYLTYQAQNNQNTEVNRGQVSAGLVYTPSANLLIGAGIDYADRRRYDDTSAGSGQLTESDNGPGINGRFSYTTPDLVFTGNGEWTTAAPTARFFGALQVDYALQRGRLSGRVYQSYIGTGSGADEARVTGATLTLTRPINTVSSLALGFGYATQVDVPGVNTGPAQPDINRSNITATYSHAITDAVSADIGYIFSTRSEDPQDAQSNAVFFQIGRTFQTLP